MNYLFNYIYIILNWNKNIIEGMPIVIVQSAIVQFYAKKQVEKVEYIFLCFRENRVWKVVKYS